MEKNATKEAMPVRWRRLFALLCMVGFLVCGCSTELEPEGVLKDTSGDESNPIREVEQEESEILTAEAEETPANERQDNYHFKAAIESIGMDFSDVKNIQQLDGWSSGSRYSFVYDGFGYIVYEFDNGEIASISTEYKSAKIYERGYEPLNYKDFEPDKNALNQVQQDALYQITNYITGVTSLDVRAGSMLYARVYDYYSMSGEINAKNATDKEVYTFTADYIVSDNSFECVYIAIDGNNVYGSEDYMPDLPKVELEGNVVSVTDGGSIVLSDGKEGEYGQYDLFDGEPCLRYYVPAGTYTVKCNVRGGFYVETVELHKEDGWDVATTIQQVDISPGEEIKITVEDGQCIRLYINTEIELISADTVGSDERSQEQEGWETAYQKGEELGAELIEKMDDIDWEENYGKAEDAGKKVADYLNKLLGGE